MPSLRTLIHNGLALALLMTCLSSHAVEIGNTFTDDTKHDCEWHAGILLEDIPGYTVKIGTCEGRSEAWLNMSLPTTEGKRERVVVDQLRVGTMTENQRFDWSMVCYLPKQNSTLMWFPILDHSRKQPLTHKNGGILAAWRVNP